MCGALALHLNNLHTVIVKYTYKYLSLFAKKYFFMCTLLCFNNSINLLFSVFFTVIDCTLSDWGAWSECDSSCGTGMMSRTRKIMSEAQNGGKHCPSTVQKRGCQGYKCHSHSDRRVLRGKCFGVELRFCLDQMYVNILLLLPCGAG